MSKQLLEAKTTAPTRGPAIQKRSPMYQLASLFARVGALPLILLALILFFAISAPVFFTTQNLSTLATQSVFLLLVATAQLLVLIAGGFDLSVGANIGLTSVASATVMAAVYGGIDEYSSISLVWGIAIALLVGGTVGLANGIGVAVLKVNPFIITLASSGIVAGLAIIVSKGQQITGLPKVFTQVISAGTVAGIPWLLVLSVPIVAAVYLLLSWTKFGRHLYAIGGNSTAANVAGVKVTRYLVITYTLAGLLVGLAGWLLTARVTSGQPSLGTALTMQSVTAALIGGASLYGGRGGVGGLVMGAGFIMLLTNGMNLLRMDTNTQSIAVGVALVLAVVIDRARERTRVWVRAHTP